MKFIQLVYTCNGVHLKNKQFYREKIPFVFQCLGLSEMYLFLSSFRKSSRIIINMCAEKSSHLD